MEKREQILTKKGYDFFEVSSSFQKSIRRSIEDDAMYWATEFIESNFEKYLWKRMFVMVSEDIGLANCDLPMQFHSLHYSYELLKKAKAKEYKLPIYHCVLLLVRSPKSRLIDWAHGRYQDGYYFRENDKKIPDYALDMHTRKGKSFGRGIDYFFSDGCKLGNKADIDGEQEYHDWCKARWTDRKWCKDIEKKRIEMENRENNQQSLL
jgi:replication-associated recombination protein RarA